MGSYQSKAYSSCEQNSKPEQNFTFDDVTSFEKEALSAVKVSDKGHHNAVLIFREVDTVIRPECVVIRADLIRKTHPIVRTKQLSFGRMKCWTVSSLCEHYHWSKEDFADIFARREQINPDYEAIKEFVIQYVINNPEFDQVFANCWNFRQQLWNFMMAGNEQNDSLNEQPQGRPNFFDMNDDNMPLFDSSATETAGYSSMSAMNLDGNESATLLSPSEFTSEAGDGWEDVDITDEQPVEEMG